MKNIKTSNILDPSVLQPFTGRSLRFLQESKDDDVASIIKAIVLSNIATYSLTVPYVISGCVVSNVNKSVTAGEVFYGGKYYETTNLTGVTNIAQFILTQTQDATADPLTFSDSSVKNVHDVFKFVATDTATVGTFNATQLNYFLASAVLSKLTVKVDAVQSITSQGVYVDLTGVTLTTPNDGKTRNWMILYNGHCKQVGTAVAAILDIRIVDGPATTIYTSTKAGKESAISGFIHIPVSMHRVVLTGIVPNTILKLQAFRDTGDCSIESQNFSLIEI